MFIQRAQVSTKTWHRRFVILLMLTTTACTHRLTETDCARYRDRLKQWSLAKGNLHENKDVADGFMKSCIDSALSKTAYRCLEQATHEEAFFKCLE